MKINLIQQVPYRHFADDFEQHHESVVTTPYALVEPRYMHEAFQHALDELMHAARSGFDGLAVTEHGQSSYDMAPNPNILMSAIAYATQQEKIDAAIYPLGRSLGKAREPLRVAEEYAMIDCITNGRLIAGFPVGLAYDANINNAVAPIEQRARYDENLRVILRAWSEREPFAWNGKFSQHPIVNIWPRPLQQPRPPVWMTGIGTPKSMVSAIERGFGYNYFGWFGYKVTGKRIFDRFWETIESLGQDRNPYRIGFLQAVVVADSDAEAERLYAKHVEYFFRKALGALSLGRMALPGQIEVPGLEALFRDPGDFGMFAKMKNLTFKEAKETGCVITGSPESVVQEISAFVRDFRIGNFHAMLHFGSMPHELAKQNIELFAKKVIPGLKQIWAKEDWPHHWWPQRLGGVPMPAAKAEQQAAAVGGAR